MTTVVDYTSLQAAIVEYLARDQDAALIARIPTFIQFVEAKLNRYLFVRQMETRATALTDGTLTEPEFIALPSDFQSMRRIRLSSVSGKPLLSFLSPAAMDDYRSNNGNVPGQPLYFTIFSNEIELAPTPGAAYTIEMIYRQVIPALASNPTNWLLSLAPDVYLYGALLESAPYLKNDDRIQVWGTGFTSALDGLNALGNTSTFNAGPLQMRSSGSSAW